MAAPMNVKWFQSCQLAKQIMKTLPSAQRTFTDTCIRRLLLKHRNPVIHSKLFIARCYSTPKTEPKIVDQGVLSGIQTKDTFMSAVELENMFPVRYIFVRTNVDVWEDFPHGVEFDVGYADTAGNENVSSRAPVILGVPSSAETHTELTSALMSFARLGYRVVIPNMPDNGICRGCKRKDSTIFLQTVEDRAQFIVDFLKELLITKVDMVVANSCSVYSAVNLACKNKDLVKSLVLLNPTGLHYTRAMYPLSLNRSMAYIWDERYYLQPLLKALIAFGKVVTNKRRWPSIRVIAYAKVVRQLNLSDGQSTADSGLVLDATDFVKLGIPVCAMYGETARTFNKSSSKEYLEILGIPQSLVSVYDTEGQQTVKRASSSSPNIGVYMEGWPADVQKWHLPLVRRTLLNFLKSVKPDL